MKRLSNLMLFSNFISTLFYAASYPYIYVELVKTVTRGYISFEQFATCGSIVIFGAVWNKYGDKLFKYYQKFLIVEIVVDTYLFIDVIVRQDLRFYFVLNILIYVIITKNITCGGIKMRAKVHPDEASRERYDNNSNSVYAIATILGTLLIVVVPINLKGLFILALIGNTIDNFFYLYIYRRLQTIGAQAGDGSKTSAGN